MLHFMFVLKLCVQEEVLTSVIDKSIILGEVKEKAAKYRSSQTIRRALCKYKKIRETGVLFHGANLFISMVPEVQYYYM